MILTKRELLEKLWDIDGDFVDEHTLAAIISKREAPVFLSLLMGLEVFLAVFTIFSNPNCEYSVVVDALQGVTEKEVS